MDDKWGTLIYLIILVVIGVAGALKKKKQQQEKKASAGEKESASVFEKLITGAGITDMLLEDDEKQDIMSNQDLAGDQDMTEKQEVSERKGKYGPAPEKEKIPVNERESYNWDTEGYFLSPEHEEEFAFSGADKGKATAYATQEYIGSNYKQKEKISYLEEIMEDFDPLKAIIYSEILDRNYF
ncbi:MAG TPA: hypothetical protein ENK25_07620 [Bacteroidetes bacterium]|nr:hypothetical protein [Bacteroidota bacterium]